MLEILAVLESAKKVVNGKKVSDGKHVTIFETKDEIAEELNASRRKFLVGRLLDRAEICCKSIIQRIEPPYIFLTEGNDEIRRGLYDTVIIATGRKPQRKLLEELASISGNMKIFTIGDAMRPALATDAIHEATALSIQLLKGVF